LLEPTRLRRAAVLPKFDFMEPFFMFATLAPPAVTDPCLVRPMERCLEINVT